MKKNLYQLLLPLLLLASWGARAQTPLQSQSFENGETVNYTASTVASGNSNIYFTRASLPVAGYTYPSGLTNIRDVNGNNGGTYFWASENVRRDPNAASPVRANPPANLTLNALNVTGKSNFSVKVALADAAANNTSGTGWETNDFVRIQYRFDGGTWANATGGQFVGTRNEDTGVPSFGPLVQDADGNGVADSGGATLTQALTDYTFAIPGSGSTLEVRVQIDQDGASEEFGFDAIRVYGSAAASAAPVLSNLESTALNYAEGQGAVPITNTLTISDDGTTLTGARVAISANFQSSEDQLVFINQNGITGSYNTGTGVLTMSGTAAVATYQAALRSIQYQNTDTKDASPLTRTVSFSVTDATNVGSNTVARNIAVTTALDTPGGLPYAEDLENGDGEGTRYATNKATATLVNGRYFNRTNVTSEPAGQWHANGSAATTISGINNSYYWWVSGSSVLSGGVGTFTTKQTNTAGYYNLNFSVKLAASNNVWENGQYLRVSYRLGGSNGTWQPLLSFRSTDQTTTTTQNSTTGNLRQDANPATTTGVPTGAQLTPTLTTYSAALPASANGQLVDFRIEALSIASDGVGEVIAFDNLQLTGSPIVAPTVTTGTTGTITTTTAAVNNNTLSSDGGASLTDYGVVYVAGTGTPTTSNTKVQVGTSSPTTFPSSFAANLTGLTPGTQYTVRAYATNSVGTSYGANVTFTTATPTITLAPASPLPGGTVATAYSQTLTASGGTAPYSYAITAGALPAGLTLTSAGVLSGTPTAGGTFSFRVNATDAAPSPGPFSGSQAYSLTIAAPTITVAPASLPNGATNTTYSQAITASGGTAPYRYAITAGALPAGLTLTAAGVLSGTPTASGSFTFTVTATDASTGSGPYSGSRSYTLNIAGPAIAVGPATLPAGTVAAAYSQALSASGGTAPYTYAITAGALPAGLTLTSAGVVAGTPTAGGTFNFTVTAFDASTSASGGPYTGSRSYALTIAAPTIAVGPASLPNGTQGTAYSQALSASGGTAPYTYAITAGALPSGLSLSSSGTIAGTPTTNGTFNFTVTATDASTGSGPYTGSRSYTLVINSQPVTAAPVVTTPANNSFSNVRSVTVTGTAPAGSTVSIYIGSNLAGTTPASATGAFSYLIPGNAPDGTYTVSATAQSSGATTSASSNVNTFTIDGTAPTVALSSATVASGNSTSTSPVSFTATFNEPVTGFTSSGITVTNGAVTSGPTAGSGNTYTFQVTPRGAGNVTVTVLANAAQDRAGNNNTASSQYAFTFQAPTIAVGPATLPNGTQNTAYSQALTASGGTAPYTYAITAGALPAGLSLSSNGTIAGTPTTNGNFTFTVTATDASAAPGPYSGARSYTLTISTQPVTAAPVVTAPANGSLTNSNSVTYQGTAPAGSTVTVYVDGASIGVTTATGGNWSLVQPTALAQGSHTVYATAQASGSAGSANSNTNTFTVDSVRPSVAVSSSAGASGGSTSTSPIPYTVTFSENVTGFVAGDVSVTGGTLSGFTAVSGITYTFNMTPSTSSSTVTVNIAANVTQDQAGNGNTAASQYSLTFVAPTITVGPASLPNGTQGTAYSQALSAAGGTAPYSYSITAGALPAGLSLNLSNGTIAGTPTANGTFNFTVTATDASTAPGPYSGSRSYSLTITAPTVTSVTWTGNTNTDWFNASNWTPNQVPDATIDAVIPTAPTGGRFPVITSNTATAQVRNLTINSGATLTQTNNVLALAANLTNNGTFRATSGTVILGNTSQSNILGASNTRFWNLTVGSNGAQQSTSASTSVQRLLTLNGNFAINGNPFTLESNASNTAMVVNNGSNVLTGNVTVQRFIDPSLNPNLGYHHFSSPISNATVGSLATTGFTPVVNDAYNTSAQPGTVTPFPTVYGYDQARLATATNNLPTFDKGWFSPSALSNPLAVGQGYTVNLTANQAFSLTGPQNNGNVALNLARNTGATAADAGLALVGNPYPSPLDWSQVAQTDRPGLDGVIYVFASNDPTNPYAGSYSFYNNGIGSISPVLPLGQGFFVRVSNDQAAATLTFKNSHRPTTYSNNTYRRTAAETRPLVQLTLKGTGSAVSDDAFVYFEQGSTEGFDAQYDAVKLPNPNGLNLSASVAGKQLSIDGLPELGAIQRVVPLAVGVPAAGSYSLSAAQLLNLDATPVYLRDLQAGTLTDLRLQPSYQFTVSNASALITGRFELVFSPQKALATVPAALAQQVGLYPNPAKTAAFVELPASLGRQAVTATLVDALGRVARTVVLPAQGALAHQLDLHELPTGIYALRLSTSAGVVVKRLTVE